METVAIQTLREGVRGEQEVPFGWLCFDLEATYEAGWSTPDDPNLEERQWQDPKGETWAVISIFQRSRREEFPWLLVLTRTDADCEQALAATRADVDAIRAAWEAKLFSAGAQRTFFRYRQQIYGTVTSE
jgi:hypothetical protein